MLCKTILGLFATLCLLGGAEAALRVAVPMDSLLISRNEAGARVTRPGMQVDIINAGVFGSCAFADLRLLAADAWPA